MGRYLLGTTLNETSQDFVEVAEALAETASETAESTVAETAESTVAETVGEMMQLSCGRPVLACVESRIAEEL